MVQRAALPTRTPRRRPSRHPGDRPGGRPGRRLRRYERLTPREKQVVGRVMTGASNAEIALDLGVSLATAKRHLANVMLKWRCSNRTQVAIDALWRAGFVDPMPEHKSQPETSPTSGRFP